MTSYFSVYLEASSIPAVSQMRNAVEEKLCNVSRFGKMIRKALGCLYFRGNANVWTVSIRQSMTSHIQWQTHHKPAQEIAKMKDLAKTLAVWRYTLI